MDVTAEELKSILHRYIEGCVSVKRDVRGGGGEQRLKKGLDRQSKSSSFYM